MGSYLAHGPKIYPKAHENLRAFSCISGPIFLESSIQCPLGVGLHHPKSLRKKNKKLKIGIKECQSHTQKKEIWLGMKLERIGEWLCQKLHIYLLPLILGWFWLSRKIKICFKPYQVISLKALNDSCFYVIFFYMKNRIKNKVELEHLNIWISGSDNLDKSFLEWKTWMWGTMQVVYSHS